MTMTTLKPCSRCPTGVGEIIDDGDRIECTSCGAFSEGEDRAECWNKRPIEDALCGRIALLEDLLRELLGDTIINPGDAAADLEDGEWATIEVTSGLAFRVGQALDDAAEKKDEVRP
jgi:hypothetical protein